MFDLKSSILQKVELNVLNNRNINLFVKRDDLIDENVSGNKWRKLKYNIDHAKHNKNSGILTFGGAFSNHLVATAAACHSIGMNSIGIVRGDELNSDSNETLKACERFGMQLVFISRDLYHLRNERMYHEELTSAFPNFLIVPEGGSNYYGMIGCQEIMKEIDAQMDHVFVAQGTTTTSSGIALAIPDKTSLHVVPVLKGFDSKLEMRNLYLRSGIEQGMVEEILEKVDVLSDYHFGGYGKYTEELLHFMENVFTETKIPLDPIYTGKTFFALVDWVLKNDIKNVNILFIHTGGIQGGKEIAKKEGRVFC